MARTTPRPIAAPAPRFTVFRVRHIGDHAYVQDGGQVFHRMDSADGADALVEILDAATALAERSDLLGSDEPAFNRARVAFLVAKALGGRIDHDSFATAPNRG